MMVIPRNIQNLHYKMRQDFAEWKNIIKKWLLKTTLFRIFAILVFSFFKPVWRCFTVASHDSIYTSCWISDKLCMDQIKLWAQRSLRLRQLYENNNLNLDLWVKSLCRNLNMSRQWQATWRFLTCTVWKRLWMFPERDEVPSDGSFLHTFQAPCDIKTLSQMRHW